MEESCEMCGTALHSITTRRAGDHVFCTKCGDDIVLPLLRESANVHIRSLIKEYKSGGFEQTRKYSDDIVAELVEPDGPLY